MDCSILGFNIGNHNVVTNKRASEIEVKRAK